MTRIAVCSHHRPDAIVARRAGGAISAAQFAADIRALAGRLPAGRHVLNICADRYHFAVGLFAAALVGKVSLLPSTHTPESVRQMRAFAPDVFCLRDAEADAIELPTLQIGDMPPVADVAFEVPALPAEQVVAQVFTSGSTGAPVPHAKSWGALAHSVVVEAARLGLNDGRSHTVVATVPAQHMYGFESSLLLPLRSGNAFWAGKPFYAADIAGALAAVPAPRLLVSTPFHLRALLASGLSCPPIERVLSATAPLGAELAARAEQAFDAPLLEIYGCTETGQIATRRTAEDGDWWLFDDVELDQERSEADAAGAAAWRTIAHGGHVVGRIALGDVITRTGPGRFQLDGRNADMVNVAGKRASLAYLTQQLLAIPGVVDGVFVNPAAEAPGTVARLAAVVVAPGLTGAAITTALRERIDAAFLPRPLHRVEALPRNAAGKLPQAALQELLAQLGGAA